MAQPSHKTDPKTLTSGGSKSRCQHQARGQPPKSCHINIWKAARQQHPRDHSQQHSAAKQGRAGAAGFTHAPQLALKHFKGKSGTGRK